MDGSPRLLRVLVAEDAPEIASRIASLLCELENVEVLGPVNDGTSALARVASDAPDAVVLDLNMPERNGLEVLKAIRAAGNTCFVIILTSHDEPSIRERCLALGADHFLHKAGDLELLLELIRGRRDRAAQSA